MHMQQAEVVPATPERRYSPMRAQPLVPWTPKRTIVAAWNWVIAETETGLEPPKLPARDETPRS